MNELDKLYQRYGVSGGLIPYSGQGSPVAGSPDFEDLQAKYLADQASHEAYTNQYNKQVAEVGQYGPGWQGDVLKNPNYTTTNMPTTAGAGEGYYDYDPATGQWTWVSTETEASEESSYLERLKAGLAAGQYSDGGNQTINGNFGMDAAPKASDGWGLNKYGIDVNLDTDKMALGALVGGPLGAMYGVDLSRDPLGKFAYDALVAQEQRDAASLGSFGAGYSATDLSNFAAGNPSFGTGGGHSSPFGGDFGSFGGDMSDSTNSGGTDNGRDNSSYGGGYGGGGGGGDGGDGGGGGQAGGGSSGGTGVGGSDHGGDGPGGDGDCVDPTTLVLMGDKTCKTAGSLEIGDLLYTMHETTHEFGTYPVVAKSVVLAQCFDITLTCGTRITASISHKFFTPRKTWVRVGDLKEGDLISGVSSPRVVKSVVDLGVGEVVKLTVEDAHTYVAEGLISHNKYARGGLVKLHRKYEDGGVVDPAPHGRGLDMSRVTPQQLAMMQQQDPAAMMLGIQRFSGQPTLEQPHQGYEPTYGQELQSARERESEESRAFSDMLKSAMEKRTAPTSQAEKYFRLAAAFGAPTKTGNFFESLGNAGQEMGQYAKETREAQSADRENRLKYGIMGQQVRMEAAKADVATLRQLTAEEMRDRRAAAADLVKLRLAEGKPQSEAGKIAVDSGMRPGTPEYNAFVQKYVDDKLNNGSMFKEAMLALSQQGLAVRQSAEARAADQAKRLTPNEVKMKSETEDVIGSTDASMEALKKAYALNPNTFDSSLPDLTKRKILETAGSTDPTLLNTREQDNLLQKVALSSLKATFPGAISNDERKALQEVQGIGAKSKEERKRVMLNAFQALKSVRERQAKRLNEINQGLYRETQAPAGELE